MVQFLPLVDLGWDKGSAFYFDFCKLRVAADKVLGLCR
jgi:hypothetical protein